LLHSGIRKVYKELSPQAALEDALVPVVGSCGDDLEAALRL
jgi:hypothetical protein